MNTAQIQLLRDAARQADTGKHWIATAKFLDIANPKIIADLCDEVLTLRAGYNKTPSIMPSKNALEEVFQMECPNPSCDKTKDGYAIRYAGQTYDPNKAEATPGVAWTAQEIAIFKARQDGSITELLSRLENMAHIPTWYLTVEAGRRKGYEGTLIFKYSREAPNRAQQLTFLD